MDGKRHRAREIARDYIERGDPMGWFEPLYATAGGDASQVPWADLVVTPYFQEWVDREGIAGAGKRALVVGCGLGDDAEAVAGLGFDVVAFDISPSAIEWCRKRFPSSRVSYRLADVTDPPAEWRGAFDFVLEVYTLQALPPDLRREATERIAGFVASGGTLLAVARRQAPGERVGTAPWTMTRDDLARFERYGLREVEFEEIEDREKPGVRRFRAEYHKG